MKEQNIKIKEVVTYAGHSLSANGSVNLTLKASYSELVNTIQLMQLLNNDVKLKTKIPSQKAINLGFFRIKDIRIQGDGESTIKFNGLNDYIEMDNLNTLVSKDEFVVMYESDVEIEGDEDGDSE